MAVEMDESDKKWLGEKLTNIENHLDKTCDEIQEVDSKVSTMNDTVVRTEERLNNHLEFTEKKQFKTKERWVIAFGVISSIAAVVAMYVALT